MPLYVQDLFTAAMGGGSVRRYGEMAFVMLPDAALITTRQEFQDLQRWARGRDSSGDEGKDRAQMLAHLQTVVATVSGNLDTRGGAGKIAKLAGIMRTEGMDLDAWRIPQSVRDGLPAAAVVEPPPPMAQRLCGRSS